MIPERFRHVFYGHEESEFAGTAPPIQSNNPEKEQGLLTTDCGATSTPTNSFHNMTSVDPKVVTIQLAMEGKHPHGIQDMFFWDNASLPRYLPSRQQVPSITPRDWDSPTNHDKSILCQRTEARSPRRKRAYKRTISSNPGQGQ